MSSNLFAALNATQGLDAQLAIIETALDALRHNLQYVPSAERADVHMKLRNADAAVDTLRGQA